MLSTTKPLDILRALYDLPLRLTALFCSLSATSSRRPGSVAADTCHTVVSTVIRHSITSAWIRTVDIKLDKDPNRILYAS